MSLRVKPLLMATAIISAFSTVPMSQAIAADGASAIEKGKKIAFNRKKGNCLTCHMIAGGTLTGNIAPPLVAMKARFPDKAVLRAQIWDPTVRNPDSVMPPFGKYKIISEQEIDDVVEYIQSL